MRRWVRSSSMLRADEVAREEVSHDPQGQLRLLVDERRSRFGLGLRLNRLPEPLQEHEIALDVLRRRALGGGAHDDPAALGIESLHDVLQARALGILEPPRDTGALAVRNVDEEAAWERDLGREPRALRLHRILDRLHHDRLAALDQVLDLSRALPTLELGPDDLVDVEESVLLEADLDERGLHPGQDVVDDAEVDVPGDRASLRALEIDLGDTVVLEDRDSLLADVDGDDELALRGRQRRALRRCAPAVAAARLLPIRLGVGLARLPGSRRRSFRSDGNAALRRVVGVGIGAVRSRGNRLLSSLAAATPATPSLLRPCRRALLVRGLDCLLLYLQSLRRCFLLRSCALLRRILFLLLAKAKPA